MITARVCDRCKEPVEANCSTVTRTYSDGPEVKDDLCERCMAELHKWFKTSSEEILEARKTPLMRYAEELRARAETMPIEEAVGEVPEGMIVIYPYGEHGLMVYSGRSRTLHGTDKLRYDNRYETCIVSRGKDVDGSPCVFMGIGTCVEHMSFESEGRGGMVVDAEQLGSRVELPNWW